MNADLIAKYDVPAPRYTSYPTIPYWVSEGVTTGRWLEELRNAYASENASWSLYIHIPFCESLCTYCGCNTSITKNHSREDPYIQALHREWELYLKEVPSIRDRPLREIHLGGGTPTFLSPSNLRRLLLPIIESLGPLGRKGFEGAIEVDPRKTTREHLEVLRELGFNRVSMGVQDFNPEVQRIVNRIQPVEITEDLTRVARELGFTSVNYDLIYGLPRQTLESMQFTIQETIRLRPDRIALYSYAHVPWIKASQRLFTEADLPEGATKRALYEYAREKLLHAGYREIGMDHFALPTDSLEQAARTGALHRNFMGYTAHRTEILLGLGVSSISETPTCFHQNEKALPSYERAIEKGELTTHRGHLLTDVDREDREQILALMTRFEVVLRPEQIDDAKSFLAEMVSDGLVSVVQEGEKTLLRVADEARGFLRNACLFFDRRLRAQAPDKRIFSRSI